MNRQAIVKCKSSNPEYQAWINKNEGNTSEIVELKYMPKFSIVVPVYNVEDEILIECIESIRGQVYKNWELCLVDDASTWENVRKILATYESDEQINVIYRKENGHIAKTTNDGIKIASGEFIVFSDCDDVLSPKALLEVAKVLNENPEIDFIYSDEDKLSEDGKLRHSPFFKPNWSPDTFMSLMYTNHLGVYRASIVKEIGGLRSEVNGSQDYDFTLRFMEKSNNCRVAHIPKVLYYWREREGSAASTPQAKPYAIEANRRLKEEALNRRGLSGKVEYLEDLYQFRVIYENKERPLVSIVIPSKDNFTILKQCLESIFNYTTYENYEIILVDNGSSEETKIMVEEYIQNKNVIYIYQPMPFNFSKMCNIGVQNSKGEYILLLNDDIEICQNDWLDIMLGQASLSYVGAVGAKLYYPNSNIIQHVGVTNLKVGPSHSWVGIEDNTSFYFGRNKLTYNYLAVTAACLLVSKQKYIEVGGLEESLAVAYNDMDFCFKLYEHGYYNVVRNDVQLFHHESISRGSDSADETKMKRLISEREKLYKRHPQLEGYDPFYNINLCGDKNDFSLNINRMDLESNEWKAYRIKQLETAEGHICIDNIVIEDKILIEGWFTTYNQELDNNGKVTLMLIGNVNQVLELEIEKIVRTDVAKVIETHSENTGFRCIIDSYLLHGINKIAIAFMENGNKKVIFSDCNINMNYEIKHGCNLLIDDSYKKYLPGEMLYHIENVERLGDHLKIVGYFFDKNNLYNNLTGVQIILIDQNETEYLIIPNRQLRYDVCDGYQYLPNLIWSGFVSECDIPDTIDLSKSKFVLISIDLLTKKKSRTSELLFEMA